MKWSLKEWPQLITEYSQLEGTHKNRVQLLNEWPTQRLYPWPWCHQHHALTNWATLSWPWIMHQSPPSRRKMELVGLPLSLLDLASAGTTVAHLHNNFWHLDSLHHKVQNLLNWQLVQIWKYTIYWSTWSLQCAKSKVGSNNGARSRMEINS